MEEIKLQEINRLWLPVRPYLARQVEEVYGRHDGLVLEIGPFAGLIFALAMKGVGSSFLIAAFLPQAVQACLAEAKDLDLQDKVRVIESDPSLADVPDASVDLAVFRGALFFPGTFRTDFAAVFRTLRKGGCAFVGGGYGKYVPDALISEIGERSKALNLDLGKVRVTVESVREELASLGIEAGAQILTEGGLWVVLRK